MTFVRIDGSAFVRPTLLTLDYSRLDTAATPASLLRACCQNSGCPQSDYLAVLRTSLARVAIGANLFDRGTTVCTLEGVRPRS